MLDFIHLRPINGQEVGGIYTNSNRYACRSNSLFDERLLEKNTLQSETELFQNVPQVAEDPAFAVEYENCQNRDSCGIEDENDKDGLDSTFCLSNHDENNRGNKHSRYAHQNRAMSHCASKNFKLNSEYERAA